MTGNDEIRTVLRFNDGINGRDIDALAALMTNDHRFIDSADATIMGKASALKAWEGFFTTFPDYRNVFDRVEFRGDTVAVAGHSKCSDGRLDGPALWEARVKDGKVAEWRVYEDTPENRRQLRL
jgi:ketosteroid isomerase-like protein